VSTWLVATLLLLASSALPTALPRCHSLKSMRSGRSCCRTNGFWDKSPALRPTDMTASEVQSASMHKDLPSQTTLDAHIGTIGLFGALSN
jgi:hypothetical protein